MRRPIRQPIRLLGSGAQIRVVLWSSAGCARLNFAFALIARLAASLLETPVANKIANKKEAGSESMTRSQPLNPRPVVVSRFEPLHPVGGLQIAGLGFPTCGHARHGQRQIPGSKSVGKKLS